MVWILATLAVGWVAALFAAPFLPVPLSAAIYSVGSLICHQRPDRSFWVASTQLPVCARCVGIYAGVVLGAGIAPFLGRVRRPRLLIVLSMLPALLSLLAEWTGSGRPSNDLRAITGGVAGSVVAAVVLATLHYERCVRPQPNVPNRPPTPI